MKLIRTCLPLALLLSSLTLPCVASAQEVAARRAAHMGPGINLSGWLASTGDRSDHHFQTFTTAQDLKLVHDMGFRYVRLGWDPEFYQRLPVRGPRRTEELVRLHQAVDLVLAAGLDVSITMFPRDEYKHDLLTGDNKVDDFVRTWREVAAAFAGTDPERVYFEIMNEPEQTDAYRWIGIEARVIAAMRGAAPQHTIIASGAEYSGLDDLMRTEPLDDQNVVYNFHFYEPFYFTHQGATWTSGEVVDMQDIPYPSDPLGVEKDLPMLHDDVTRLHLYYYGTQRWDAVTIRQRIDFAARWGAARHVPVVCNEFGAFKDTVEPTARARYLHDVRTALEADHIPWAMWDYRGNFGVVDRTDSIIRPDDGVLAALGLKTGLAAVKIDSSVGPQPAN